jgi:hypothetical protein
VISVLLAVVLLCEDWHPSRQTVASAFNDDYHVVAWNYDTDATTPTSVELALLQSGDETNEATRLCRAICSDRKAKIWLLPQNLLFASTFWDIQEPVKSYFVADLDNPPDPLDVWGNREFLLGELLCMDSSSVFDVTVQKLRDREDVVRVRLRRRSAFGFEEVYMVGLKNADVEIMSDAGIRMDLEFTSGKRIQGCVLDLHSDDPNFLQLKLPADSAKLTE